MDCAIRTDSLKRRISWGVWLRRAGGVLAGMLLPPICPKQLHSIPLRSYHSNPFAWKWFHRFYFPENWSVFQVFEFFPVFYHKWYRIAEFILRIFVNPVNLSSNFDFSPLQSIKISTSLSALSMPFTMLPKELQALFEEGFWQILQSYF